MLSWLPVLESVLLTHRNKIHTGTQAFVVQPLEFLDEVPMTRWVHSQRGKVSVRSVTLCLWYSATLFLPLPLLLISSSLRRKERERWENRSLPQQTVVRQLPHARCPAGRWSYEHQPVPNEWNSFWQVTHSLRCSLLSRDLGESPHNREKQDCGCRRHQTSGRWTGERGGDWMSFKFGTFHPDCIQEPYHSVVSQLGKYCIRGHLSARAASSDSRDILRGF